MVVRNLLLAVRLLIVLSSLLMVACAVVVWRIASGPVSLDFMEPYLADAFNAKDHGLQIEIGQTWLIWRGFDHGFDIVARNWQVRDLQGEPLASLPDVTIAFSSEALARGVLAPRSLSAEGARLTLVRDTDGRFAFSPADAAEDGLDLSAVAQPILDRLLGPRDGDRPLTFLSEVRLSNGSINYVDRRLGGEWRAEAVDLRLARADEGLTGTLRSSLRLSQEGTGIAVRLAYDRRTGRLQVEGDIAPVRVATLASLIPQVAGRLESTLSVHGAFDLAVTLPDGAFTADLSVQGGAGQFRLVGVQPDPLSLRSVALALSIEDSGRKVALRDASVALAPLPGEAGDEPVEGPRLTLTATAEQTEAGTLLTAAARADRVEARSLARLWPPQAAVPAREWVTEHILDGTATNGEARVSLLLPEGGAPELREAGGSFRFQDVTADYFPPLPAAHGLDGLATFDADSMTFDVITGSIEGLDVTEGRVAITGLKLDDQSIDIAFGVRGALAEAWKILDHPRLRLISKLGVESGRVGGDADARLHFAFPLVDDLTPEQLQIDASARLRGVTLGRAVLGQDVTKGDFDLEVDNHQMRLSGPLQLAAVPMRAQWTEVFEGRSAGGRIIAEVPDLPVGRLADLGLPVAPYLDGRLQATIAGRVPRVGRDLWSIQADLGQADLTLPEIGWRKPAGAAGKASARLEVEKKQLLGIEDLVVEVPGSAAVPALSASGRIGFDRNGRWRDATLEKVRLAGSTLDLVTVSKASGTGIDATVAGGVLDAAWLADHVRPPGDASTGSTASGGSLPDVRLTVHQLSKVLLGQGRWLEDVALDVATAKGEVARLAAAGRYPQALLSPAPAGTEAAPKNRRLSVTVKPAPEGFSLTASTGDFGALVRLLGFTRSVVGGTLQIDAKGTGRLLSPKLTGTVSGGSFLLRGAPLLARVLLIASLTGLGDALAGDGVSFDTLSGDFTYDGERLSTDLLRAYGASLGISVRGDVDFGADRLDLSGTLVPAYAINRVIGAIPLLGFLITGGENDGLLGVNYSLTGALDDPQFQVNPLSALAPGFLKWLFDLPVGDAGSTGNPVPPHMSIENRG